MAVGDAIIAHSSVGNGAVLTIQPAGSTVWLIQNLYMGGAWELHRTDGSNDFSFQTGTTADALQQRMMVATNTVYFTLKNTSGGAVYMGYDGFVLA